MYIPTITLRNFEPYRKSEYSGDTADAFKVIVKGGKWHFGNRYATIGNTELTIVSGVTKAIYVEYNRSIYGDYLTVAQGDVATVLALLTGSDGHRYHHLGNTTTSVDEIISISDAWEGGDILSAYTDNVDVDNHSIEFDSSNYSPDTKLAIYGFNTGAPMGSAIGDYAMFPFAQGSLMSDLLWTDLDTLADKLSGYIDNLPHTWYYDANYHTDGPPTTSSDGAFLQWTTASGLIWNSNGSANWWHSGLYDIVNNIGTDDHNGSPTANNWPYVSGKSQGSGRNYFAANVGLQDAAGNITLKPNERYLLYGDWTHKGTDKHFLIEGTDSAYTVDNGCLQMQGGFSFKKSSWGSNAAGMVVGLLGGVSEVAKFYNPSPSRQVWFCTSSGYGIYSDGPINVTAGFQYYHADHQGYDTADKLRILKSGGGFIEAYIRGGILCVD